MMANPRGTGAWRWVPAGLLAGILLGLADAAMLAWGAREMFLDRGELLRTAGHVVLLCAGAGALAGALAAVLVAAGHRLSRPGGPLHGTGRREVALAALLCAPLAVVGWLLTAGPKASALPWRPLIVLATAALLGLAASWSALRLARWSVGSVGRRLALAAGAVVLAAVAVAIDRSTFVRLYPAFHASLAAGAWLVATAGLAPLGPIPRHRLARAALAVLVAAAVVGGGLSLASLRGMQNARFVVSERTGAAARLLDLARAARPPADPWLEETAAAAPSPVSSGPAPLLAVVRPRASVHLISIDAMRADRLLPPDGARAPAPNLDALAREGVVFTRAYTPIPHTSYALASLLTGKYLYPLFEVPGAPPVHETLPGILGRFRYRSAGFFTRAIFFIDRARFEPYLRSGFGFGHADIEYSVPAPELADRLVTHLVETRDDPRPILTWLHLFEPHEPYDPACTRFGASPEERYDCEIAVADEAAGRLLDHLRESDPGAIVIAFADHGEEFGDHGGRYHGSTLYDEQVRVPLVIRVPGLPHRVVDEPVNLVDLPATILALLDIPVPARMRSRDLTGLLAGHPPEGPGETFSELPEEVMTVREGHKLICGRHSGICRLHDLAEDPGETRNLAESRAELTRSLRARIAAFEAGHAERELRPVVTDAERAGWPAPIRAALTGGAVDREALIGLIEQGAAPEFRRKAAEILAREAATDPARLPAGDPAADPEVEAWLALASGAGADRLGELAPDLEPGSAVRRAVTLARLEQGDRRATADALALVADSGVPLAERLRGLDLLGRYGSRAAAEGLTGMLDDYRVSTAVAGALARLGHRPAVPRLIARMARERFPERREALAAALGALRDRRAIEPLARELLREEPAPLALRALVDVGAATSRGTRIRAGDPAREVVVFAPAAGVFEGPDRILRLALLTRAAADGGELVARCDGAEVARVPLVAGDQAVVVDIEDCGGGAHPPRIELALEPVDAEASIPAAALIGAP